MNAYRLLFVGCFTAWKNNTSCEYFSDELSARFDKLPHVTVIRHHFDSLDIPEADVALVHSYSSEPVVKNVALLKTKVKKAAYFMEEPLNLGFDHYYYYDACHFPSKSRKYISVPLAKSQYLCEAKEPGSVLLDHDSQLFPYYRQPDHDWNERLWEYFTQNRHKYGRIVQLERGKVTRPSFIETIPLMSHIDYLRATSRFETFICTHAGSYNHTAVDMAVRGSRVIVPAVPHTPHQRFIPLRLVRDLNMKMILDEKELAAALDQPFEMVTQIHRATDLDDVVARMDEDFRGWLTTSDRRTS